MKYIKPVKQTNKKKNTWKDEAVSTIKYMEAISCRAGKERRERKRE